MKSLFTFVLAIIALTSCDESTSNPEAQPDSPVGQWEFAGKVSADSLEFRILVKLNADKRASFSQYVSSMYKDGFDGSWNQIQGDTLAIIPKNCFKSDITGAVKPNICSEDFDYPSLKVLWSGGKIIISDSINRISLTRI